MNRDGLGYIEWHEPVYGRRVEMDRRWTVYHVFTGIPAEAGCGRMTGLSKAEATIKMMSLNSHAGARCIVRAPSSPYASPETA